MIRPSGYTQLSVGGKFSHLDVAYYGLKKRHWAVHDAAHGILPGR